MRRRLAAASLPPRRLPSSSPLSLSPAPCPSSSRWSTKRLPIADCHAPSSRRPALVMRPRVHFASAALAPTAKPPDCMPRACLVPAFSARSSRRSPALQPARTSVRLPSPDVRELGPRTHPPSQPLSRHLVDRSARFDQCPSPTLIFDQSINQPAAAGRPSSPLRSARPLPRQASRRPPAADRTANTLGLTDPSPAYYALLNRLSSPPCPSSLCRRPC